MGSKQVLARSTPPTPPSGTAIVTDPLEIRRLLTRAAAGHTSSSLKIRGSEESPLRGSLLDGDPTREGLQLKLSSPLPDAQTESTLAAQECMLLIYLQGRSILGVNAVPSSVSSDLVTFGLPQRVFKIQRRKDVRFQIPAAYEFTVEVDSIEQKGTRVRKRIVDLSESGLSFFILSPREAALFRRGMFFHRCVIRMQSHRIETSLKIRNHLPLDRGSQGSGHKIGAEFEDMSPEDREFVAQFVYSHAAHLFY